MAPPKQGEQLVKAVYNDVGPLTLHTQSVLLKLTAPTTEKRNTAELDFVAVLDTSGSMHGRKLDHMKEAMKFVIDKLGKNDRLAIVTFNSDADTNKYTVPEQLDDKKALEKANSVVDGLHAKGDTNIGEGLRRGMELLTNRKGSDGFRAACIFLMSDGVQNRGDARKVLAQMPRSGTEVHYWTVHTFGFGEKHDETLLWEIAQKSHAGVYHHVLEEESNNLSMAFAPTLGQCRSISMLGVEVTVTRKDAKATILVKAGDCRVEEKGETWTIKFGDLAREENRRIMIDVQFPDVPKNEKAKPVLAVEYTYNLPVNETNTSKKRTKGPRPVVVEIARNETGKSSDDMNRPEVEREIARNRLVESIAEVKKLADKKDMDGAMRELKTAKKKLYDLGKDPKGESVIDALFTEVDNIAVFLKKYADYDKLGRAYLLACLSSHRRQRYTPRGGEEDVPLFLTKRGHKYRSHAAEFMM